MSKLSGVYSEMFHETLHPQVLIDMEKWTNICTVREQLFMLNCTSQYFVDILSTADTTKFLFVWGLCFSLVELYKF